MKYLLGGDSQSSYGGRVILVKCGEYARKIGIDGTTDAIKDVIKSAFGLRTKRAFWLEDEDEVIRSLDRRMPLGTYTLHLDEGDHLQNCLNFYSIEGLESVCICLCWLSKLYSIYTIQDLELKFVSMMKEIESQFKPRQRHCTVKTIFVIF